MRGIIFISFFLFSGFVIQSQTASISGKILDDTQSPSIGSSVILLNPSDSSLVKGTITDVNGKFMIDGLEQKSYLLKVLSLGYKTLYKSVSITSSSYDLGTISLRKKTNVLNEVTVEGKIPLATQNGDTTSYGANAYKVNKDATAEDLVTKMPGVTIVNGKVQAQGEDVKQVLVDGKPFFGDDPNAVLKNLPAEIIDKVQVFDKKSDQAQFTGFDDGNSSKTINITTKAKFRNGIFGKACAGYGYSDKYKAGGVFNYFKDQRRLTVLLQSNNINDQNFSAEDLLGVMSSGSSGGGNGGVGRGMGGGRGPGGGGPQNNANNFLTNTQNGINTTHALGINYSDKWGKKTDVTVGYFFNWAGNHSSTTTHKQYIIGSNYGLVYNENNVSINNNTNHRLNLRFETKLDSQNTIMIQPKFSFQINDGSKSLDGKNTRENSIISETNNSSSSTLSAYNINVPVLWRHSFRKKGRTLSVFATPSLSNSDGLNTLYTLNRFYNDTLSSSDTLDQHSKIYKPGFNGNGNITYTEPINKNHFILFNYSTSYIHNYSSKKTYNRNPTDNAYSDLDSLLTNVFANQYQSHSGSLGYRFQKEKINFSVGAAYQYAVLTKNQKEISSYTLSKTFESILPNAQFQYKFTPKKNLRLFYRSNNNAPSVDQLQDVVNNSNSLQLTTGNPTLKQDFQQNLTIRYSSVNTEKATSLFILLGGNYSNNYIGNSTLIAGHDTVVYNQIFLQKGSQIQRPVNIDGYYSLRSFINYSFPIKKTRTNININVSGNYSHVPGIINQQTNFANTASGIFGLVLSSNISEKIDFTISSNSSYNNIINTLQTNSNSNYFIQTSGAKINITLLKSLVLNTEYNNQYYSGLSSSYNQSISLWTAAIAYKFLKNKQAEIRLMVYDILNQNNSIQRTNTDSYIQDTQTNVLRRYYMVVFTYNFRKYFEKKEENK